MVSVKTAQQHFSEALAWMAKAPPMLVPKRDTALSAVLIRFPVERLQRKRVGLARGM